MSIPMILRATAGLSLALALFACAPLPSTQGPSPQPPSPVAANDPAACAATGGHLEKHGKLQASYCIHPAADAGKACSGKSDCAGACLTAVDAAPGTAVAGTCQPDDGPLFGCNTTVEGGKVERTLCKD